MTTTIRQRIERGFENLGHLIYRNHWKVLLLVALLAAGLISQLPKLTMDTSTEGFLHDNDPTLIAYNAYREQYGRDELVLVAIESQKIFTQPFLKKLKQLHDELRDNTPYLDDITSLVNARNTRGAEGELIVEDLLENWPEDEAAMQALRERSLSNPTYRNMLIAEDASITTIVIKTDAFVGEQGEDVMAGFEDDFDAPPSTGAVEQKPLTDAQNSEVVNTVRNIIEKYQGEDFTIHLAGSPSVSDELKRRMMTNMKRFMLTALGAIALILFLLFRRVSGVLLPLFTVALSLLSTLGVMGLTGIPFKLVTQILPSFLLAVGVGATVHLLAIFFRELQRLHQDRDNHGLESSALKEKAIVHALGHSGMAIFMTSLTTAAGLASFVGSQVAPVNDLGLMAASGVMISLFYTLVLIPALLSIAPLKAHGSAAAQGRHARMDRILVSIADFSTQRPKTVLAISALVLALGFAGAMQVKFSHKPFEWLPETEPVRIATDLMDQRMRGASTVEVVVNTQQENGLYDPAFLKGLDSLNREVETIDQGELFVGKTLSLADILKEIHKALNENRDDFYTIPDDKELIAQEFLLFENSGSDDLEDFVDSQFSQTRFTAKMPWVDAVLYQDFIDDLKARFHRVLGDVDVSVTGMAALLGRTMHATIQSMAQSYLLAAGVITLMMILLIGNVRIGLVSMIPNLTPIILTLGIMGWLGLPIDLFTMLIGSIAIGLAVDDTIHFMHNYRRYHHETGDVQEAVRQTLLTTGRAMLVTTIVLSTGFFLYMFSDLSSLFNFGLLTGFTIIMALLADFFLAPALMAQLHRAHLIADDSDY